MKVTNIHKRMIRQPISKIGEILATLSSDNDKIVATDKWPPVKLDKGLQIGSKGGHGFIKYFLTDYQLNKSITFQFSLRGFNGFHKFELIELDTNTTEISHTIDMNTTGSMVIKWILAIRWLHDAFIEDALDRVESNFSETTKHSKWSLWVKFLRKLAMPKKKKKNLQ